MKAKVYYYAADTDCGLEVELFADELAQIARLTEIFDSMLESDGKTVAEDFNGNIEDAYEYICGCGMNNGGMDTYTWDDAVLTNLQEVA